MNQFLKGSITGGLIVLIFFITTAQIRSKLSNDDKKYFIEKGWVQSFFDLEINIGIPIFIVLITISLVSLPVV